MPKLPRGVYRRGRSYYVRMQRAGQDVRRSLGTNYEEAMRLYRKLMANPDDMLTDTRTTVSQAVETWLATAVATSCAPSGHRDVASRVRRYMVPGLGHRLVGRMRPADLLAFRAELERQGLPATRVRRILGDTRTFFRWAALDAQLISEPPIPRRLLPKLQERFPDRLTDEEVSKVSRIAEPYGFVMRLALATGLRWGELVRLRVSDIQGGVAHIEHTKSRRVRRVPVSDSLLQELRGRQGQLVPFKHPGMFARQVKRLSGVSRFHVHLTRHTFACRWVEAGGNLAVLQCILGHSSIVVTQRYARLSDASVLKEAKRVMGETGTVAGTGCVSAVSGGSSS